MASKRCQTCGLVNFARIAECRRCNTVIAWGAEHTPNQPGFASRGGDSFQQVPFQPAPALPYGSGYVSPYAQTGTLRSGLATTSLVLGIIGLFSGGLVLVGSIIGLINGIRALLKVSREPYVYGGKGIAIGGIVTNSLGICSFPFWALITAAVIVPNALLARASANEASAIGTLKAIVTGEAILSRDNRGRYASMEELLSGGLIDGDSAHKNGYQIKLRLLDLDGKVVPAGSSDALRFEVVATPDAYGLSGRRSFYTCEDFIIRCGDWKGREATHADPDIDHYVEDRYPARSDESPRRRN